MGKVMMPPLVVDKPPRIREREVFSISVFDRTKAPAVGNFNRHRKLVQGACDSKGPSLPHYTTNFFWHVMQTVVDLTDIAYLIT